MVQTLTAVRRRRCALLAVTGALALALVWPGNDRPLAHASPQTTMELVDSALSVQRWILEHLDMLQTPEYVAWKDGLRRFQREHYAAMLLQHRKGDGVAELFAYIRMRLRLELSLNHIPITFRNAQGALIPLPQDWSFPADPWQREDG